MFPSSGLLTRFNCHLYERRLCKRPHCVFKHGAEVPGSEATAECLGELERINREIESVKHQVEVEQRRLTNYQIKLTSTTTRTRKSEVVGQNVVKDACVSQTYLLGTPTQPKKYTLDSSKPRTDLEYDPLSNFSSDLRSYCSSKRDHKNKNEHSSEEEKSISPRMPDWKVPQSQKQSLEHPDSNEDEALIIDLPPSPVRAKAVKTTGDCPSSGGVSVTMNGNGRNHRKNESLPLSQRISISDEENIFVKLSQHLSTLSGHNATQSSDTQDNARFEKNSSQVKPLPGSETRARQTQKPETPGPNMTNGEAQRKMNKSQLPVFVGSLCEPQDILSAAKWTQNTFHQPAVINKHLHSKEADVVVLDSSSDEMNYSDIEVSESDPDEECYRIFMEANGEDEPKEPAPDFITKVDAQKSIDLQQQASTGKKRVSHEARATEVGLKVRAQPKVLVPLCAPVSSTFPSQPPAPLLMRRVEQRASILSASIRAGQALIRGQSETKHAQTAPCTAPSVNYIPLGATLIDVDNSLHLVLPEGTFPVSDSSGRASSVLTPITPVNPDRINVKLVCRQSTHALQPKRTTQPPVIPAQAGRPIPAASAAAVSPCSTTHAPVVKPVGIKRKTKQKYETVKVPHDVRQSYVNKFTEEFLKTTSNINEAFGKALAEERTVYNRSANKLKYLSVAVNALKKLKSQGCGPQRGKLQSKQKTKGNIPLDPDLLNGKGIVLLYDCLKDYVLTEEMLIESNFPFQNPEKPGSALLFSDRKQLSDSFRKLCCRCGATYSVNQSGRHIRKEECVYHHGRGVEKRVPGGMETRYSCCEGVMGSPGCQVFKLHVCNSLSMEGFVSTAPRDPADTQCPGVYSLDCEKCYTISGLELSRVTVVNSDLQIVYDTFVQPSNEVIDFNTRFSGISEQDMKGQCHSLKEVQNNLLSFLNADTILIGHGLETNLCVLKLLHGRVVDTSVVFPHRLGPPHKLSLHSLTAEYLRKIIQESVCGRDTAEDALACMELMLWKAKEDGKLKKAQFCA